MRDALQMSSPDSAAPTCHPKKPLGQPRVPLPTSKNRSSADPLDQRSCRQGLQAISMENPTQFTASNDRGRRQVMRRKLRWMKRAMCPWRLLRTRINVCDSSHTYPVVRRWEKFKIPGHFNAILEVPWGPARSRLQKAHVARADQHSSPPVRAKSGDISRV
jgi:hypothetical protein